MATIKARRRAKGMRYTAVIRIQRHGAVVYQESRTFSRRALATDWARRREVELEDPAALARVLRPAVSVSALVARYVEEISPLRPWSRTKSADLRQLRDSLLGEQDATRLKQADLIEHIRQRREAGAGPATANNDLVWLRSIWRTARAMWGYELDMQVIDDAAHHCRTLGLTARAKQRDRRPTRGELARLLRYFRQRDRRSDIPMADILLFAVHSARRQDEITRLRWCDLDAADRTILVPDLKHPRHKSGHDKRAKLTRAAYRIIQRQPRREGEDRIFPYNSKSIGAAFTRACRLLGIVDLRFHDLRREAISRLFEAGYSVQEVQLFSLHESWATLAIYTELRAGDVPDR